MGEAKNTEAIEAFIRRWQGLEGGQERANYVSFLNELIEVLGLPKPDPAAATHEHNDYVFERSVRKHRDEGDSHGRIDLYKKNSFVLEAKQSRLKGVKKVPGQNDLFTAEVSEDSRGRRGADRAWDVLMLNAKRQAEEYARALPTSHGWLFSSAMSATASRSMRTSPDRGKTIPNFRIARPSAFIWKTCATTISADACGKSGSILNCSIPLKRRRRLQETSPGWNTGGSTSLYEVSMFRSLSFPRCQQHPEADHPRHR
jgi:hypothetical protein